MGFLVNKTAADAIGWDFEKIDACCAHSAEEIFERFAKLDNNKQGAGIGLTICKLIASNLNGEIWLDTDYTGGARFVFMIPYVESADQR